MNPLATTHLVIILCVTVTCLIVTKCLTQHLILAHSSRVQSTVLAKSRGGAWGSCPHIASTVRSQREMSRWAQLSVSLLLRSGPWAVEECRPQRLDLPIVTKIGLIQTPHSYAERLVPRKILDAIKLTTEFKHHNWLYWLLTQEGIIPFNSLKN